MSFIFFRLQASKPSTLSSHEMRYKPILGQYARRLKSRGNEREEVWKMISMCGNGTMTLQGDSPVATIFSRVTHLLEDHVNHQGEMRRKA